MTKKLALKLPNVSKNVIYTPEGDTLSAGNIFLKNRRIFLIIGLYSEWHKYLVENAHCDKNFPNYPPEPQKLSPTPWQNVSLLMYTFPADIY